MQDLVAKNKTLKNEFNHLVDTNQKIIGNENFKKVTNVFSIAKYEVYTTLHALSAQDIYDYIGVYLDKRGNRPKSVRKPDA